MRPIAPEPFEKYADPGRDGAGRGFVLPRLARRPFRLAQRFVQQGTWLSPRAMIALAVLIIGGGGIAGIVRGGHADKLIAQASAIAGFRIADIDIKGAHEVSRIDVLTNIDLGAERSLFSFDAHQAREDLKRLTWVRDAAVSKAYPDRLVIEIVERQPFAIWQNGQALYLVARDGAEIVPYDDRYAGLPLVVGKGAAAGGADMIAAVARFPELSGRVKAYVRVGDRRWNLTMDNGIMVKLPEHETGESLVELARLEREDAILSRAVRTIDLRLPGRLVFGLPPEAAEAHREAVKHGAGEKKRERSI